MTSAARMDHASGSEDISLSVSRIVVETTLCRGHSDRIKRSFATLFIARQRCIESPQLRLDFPVGTALRVARPLVRLTRCTGSRRIERRCRG